MERKPVVPLKVYYLILFISAGLGVFGLFSVYSATRTFMSISHLMSQTVAFFMGVCAMVFLAHFDYRLFRCFNVWVFVICTFMLLAVLLGGITGVWGSKSWIKLGPLTLQPSEPAKLCFIISFGVHLERVKNRINTPVTLLLLIIHLLVPLSLIMLQPDFGTAIVFVFIFVFMMFSAGLSYKIILSAVILLVICAPIIYYFLDDYQQGRIQVFLDPGTDPLGKGFNVIKSRITLGSGQLLGRGYLNGANTQLGTLPAKHTDFIFSTVAEELGFIGAFVVLTALFVLIALCFMVSVRSTDALGKYIAVGVTGFLLFHTTENIGMCMGILPVTGIPLPFISYGGTALISVYGAIGLVCSVYLHSDREIIFYKT